jgi:hypothetical protein
MTKRWILATMVLATAACGGANAGATAAPSSPTAQSTAAGAPTDSPLGAPAQSATYACADSRGGGTTRSNVVTVRAAAGTGYDRFVIEFDGPVPGYQVTRQTGAAFTQDASGQLVTLDGSAGVLIRLAPASSSPSAPLAISPRATVLREGRNVGDFEGVVHWGLGLASAACMHVFTLDSPPRLVVDFKT